MLKIAAEDITRARASLPLNFTGGCFKGGVNTSGSQFGGKERMWLAAGEPDPDPLASCDPWSPCPFQSIVYEPAGGLGQKFLKILVVPDQMIVAESGDRRRAQHRRW
ncbi:MAG: hypothetical protein WCJ14_13550 [Verrucomicrobiota bacterium]